MGVTGSSVIHGDDFLGEVGNESGIRNDEREIDEEHGERGCRKIRGGRPHQSVPPRAVAGVNESQRWKRPRRAQAISRSRPVRLKTEALLTKTHAATQKKSPNAEEGRRLPMQSVPLPAMRGGGN